ncbi:MAG TPA: MauE/DoxX family redox-associated membrane protein [Rhizomicrobium sp.]|nr:MauE/DoxX family redox-associated membrane protein [Rhizomicrobium sp.]
MVALAHELHSAASVAGRTCVGLVFMLAAVQKAMHWRILPGVIANYRILPRWLTLPAASLLPPVEMILSILLLSAQFRLWSALAAIVLLILFAVAMTINITCGREHIDCGCGETFLRQTLNWALVARNGLLAALLVPSLVVMAPLTMSLALSGVAAGVGLFLLYLLLNILAALPPADTRRHRFA